MKINAKNMKWTRAPKQYTMNEDKIEMITEPYTDLWQRTYYHFRNDNAPVLQMETDEKSSQYGSVSAVEMRIFVSKIQQMV